MGDYWLTQYMSKEFLKDSTTAKGSIECDEARFRYFTDELKVPDLATFAKMRRTLWLNNIIQYTSVHLVKMQNRLRTGNRNRKRREASGKMKRK